MNEGFTCFYFPGPFKCQDITVCVWEGPFKGVIILISIGEQFNIAFLIRQRHNFDALFLTVVLYR